MTCRGILIQALALFALFASAGCSDSALPVAHGAAALHWDTSTGGNLSPVCVPGTHWANAPVSANDQAYVSATEILGGEGTQGKDGTVVMCRVAPVGDQYVVSAEIQTSGVDGEGNPLMTQVEMRVTIGPEQEGAQGTLYVTDQRSHFAFSSDTTIIPPKPGCIFSVNSAGGTNLGVGPGRIWTRVQCPHIQDNRNRAKQECQISEGFIALQDCVRE